MSVDGRLLDATDPARITRMLESDEVEEISVGIVPVIVGGKKGTSLSGTPGEFLPHDRRFRLLEMKEHEGVLRCRYVRDRKKNANA